ncbi:Hsp20/alpha crystallin family protein [Pseudonocardia sp. H11422]|uniref:Hsp20/alpha crystallin family protein n=1 Tax=Pseudonocardia sp. H11422 TaxID=2835866 RepID=UPI001BDCE223|nr:Hsp20/alpha crystallin family protein [Pseudonocardia sp. H11422]
MALLRSDPFHGLERWAQQLMGGAQTARSIPMEAFRRGDQVFAYFDLPGVAHSDVDITIERNSVTIRAERRPVHQEGDEVLVNERFYGVLSRQVFLGDSLDLDNMSAEYELGQLVLTIPVSERAKPRRIAVRAREDAPQQVTGTATSTGTGATG